MGTEISPATSKGKLILTPRQKKMWPILLIGIFFEGFDDALINIVLPYIRQDFNLTQQMASYALSIIGFGALLAFFIVRLADTVGRRPIFLSCVYLFSICSLITAFSPNINFLIFFQFLARIFLIGCWSIGFVIISEEFAAENRGRVIGLFQVTAVLGALFVGISLPIITKLGLNWRVLYALGSLPLIPALIFNKNLPETERFLELQENKKLQKDIPPKEDFFAIWKSSYNKYLLVMACVWILLYFGVKGSLNFFSLRVVDELGWTPNMISLALLCQTTVGAIIIAFNGKLMDKLGRKKAAACIITVGACASALTFSLTNFYAVLFLSILSAGFCNSYLIIGSTITNELFPTRFRGSAMAWTNNIIGRLGQILVPTIIGTMTMWMALGRAVSLIMLTPLIALLLIMLFIPETKTFKVDLNSKETIEA